MDPYDSREALLWCLLSTAAALFSRARKFNERQNKMQAALKRNTVVLSGGKIELDAPELPEGATVEVIVMLSEKDTPQTLPRRSVLEIIAALGGHRLFASAEDVDRHLQRERDSWE